jgi:hypothetical protein
MLCYYATRNCAQNRIVFGMLLGDGEKMRSRSATLGLAV